VDGDRKRSAMSCQAPNVRASTINRIHVSDGLHTPITTPSSRGLIGHGVRGKPFDRLQQQTSAEHHREIKQPVDRDPRCFAESSSFNSLTSDDQRLRSSTLFTVPNVKNFKFWKSKMAAAAILKNRDISAAVRAISTKFGTLMHLSQPALVLVLL